MTPAIPIPAVPSPCGTMGKPAKSARVRSTLSPRLTVKITVPSSAASSAVRQSRACWEPGHTGVEKQLNQTWVSSYRTNASSALFSSPPSALREKSYCFVVFFLSKRERRGIESEKEKKGASKRELRHLVSPGDHGGSRPKGYQRHWPDSAPLSSAVMA